MKEKKPKVLVGMSGGVDSSVAALLLQKEGYEVSGLFIDFIGNEKSKRDFAKAQKIAKKLNISIYRLDAQKVFKKEIIDKFVEDYKKGTTPNPCVMCNPEMKFRILIEEADRRGIDFVATGHYAQVRKLVVHSPQFTDEEILNSKLKIGEDSIETQDTRYRIQDTSRFKISNLNLSVATDGLKKRIAAVFDKKSIHKKIDSFEKNNTDPRIREDDNCFALSKAEDETKDQSYFLYRLTQEQLSRTIFPLGDYLKYEVREIAREHNFEIKSEEESQDVCFIADNDFNKFIAEKIPNKPGKIVNKSGEVLGEHKGLHFYTIGQRKGINLGGDGPYFVIKKDLIKNNLIVDNNFTESLWRDEFEIKNANWIKPDLKFPFGANVKIRYRTEEICAIIDELESVDAKAEKKYRVKLDQPQKAITPGQSAVFYSKEGETLGGGIII